MQLRSFWKTALWRFAGPGVSFVGQVYAISGSRDLSYQRSVFFVLAAQVLINSTDFPYFIAARKEAPRQIHPLYLPACLLSVVVAYISGAVHDTVELAYCFALTLAVSLFSGIYSTELNGGLARTTIIGTLRNTVIAGLLVLFTLRRTEVLITSALIFVGFIVYRRLSMKSQRKDVQQLSWQETLLSVLAAVLTGVFFLSDRYFIVETFQEHTRLVNQIFVAISVVLLLSNVSAVHLSGRSIITRVARYAWMQLIVVATLFALATIVFVANQERLLICIVLIATPVVFSLQSPYLLGIQERRSVASTAASYVAIFGLKVISFFALSNAEGGERLVYFIPLLGLFSPLLIVLISQYSGIRHSNHA